MASHFDSLARELSCSICLCVMSPPVARLPCCHYFCMGCVQVSVRHKAQCPVCKAKVGRRDVSGDDTMDRVVKAFAQLEAHKDELLSGGGGTRDGAGGPAVAAQGAEESLGGGQPVMAASADTSPQPEDGGGGGGICWLAGVDNNDYQSPSISFAGSAAQRRQQQQQQQQAAAAEGRRLSLHSIHTKTGDDEQPAEQQVEQEQAEEGCAELQAQPQQQPPQQPGKAPAQEALAPADDKDKENAAEQQAPAGAGWQQRVPKTTAAQRAAAAQRQRHAEGTQPITKWVHPKQMGLSMRQPRARPQQAAAGAGSGGGGSGGGGETGAAADQSSLPADGGQVQPAKQPQQPMQQQQQQQQQQEAVQESAAAAAAGCESPGVSSDLQSLALQVAATAAAVAAAASPCQGASQGASEAAEQLTPLPAPALAPRTDKVPAGRSPALEPAAVPSAAAAAAAGKPVGTGRGASKGGRASSGRKRAASGGHASEGAREAGEAAADGAAGSAVVVPPGKRGKTAAKASAGSSTAPARRRSAPALAATSAAAAAAAGASDRTPAPPLATGVGAGLASTGGVGVVSGRRRIPTRLVPWNCAHCTFENQGAASKCEICASKKKVLPSSELAADLASGAKPATVAAAAAERLQVAASPAPAAAAAAEETAGAAAAAAGKPQRQRKMSGVGGGGGAGSSRKRRKVTAAPAPVPAPADDASPAAACPAAAPNADASADGGSGWSDPRGGSSGWVLLGSSLSASARQQLQQLARVSGAAVVKEWSPKVTHVVCCTVDGAARRTFKFLRGVLAAKWVLTEAWLQACLEQEGPVNEEQFLVPADHAGCAGGAAAARSSALLGLPALLGGYKIYLAGEFANGGEVAELLLAAGAKRLSRPPAAPLQGTSGGPCTSFLLCEGPDTASSPAQHRHLHEAGTVCAATFGNAVGLAAAAVPPALAVAKWYRKAAEAGVPVVSHRWLLDTISSYTALPLSAYCL